MFSVRFWGDRGSIPCPGPDTVKYGGNTACLEIRAGRRLVIVDLGTGVRPLGDWLIAHDLKETGAIDADIFITHTHWDHIMGFPVFAPVFIPKTTLRIYGPLSFNDETLESIIATQLSYRYWPVRISELAAHISWEQIRETTLDLGDGLRVRSKYLNHPILCLGYRFEYEGRSIVTAFDHEPFFNVFPTDPADPAYNEEIAREGDQTVIEENEKLCAFFRSADILIHDSQFTEAEYINHPGWGHSSFKQAIANAARADVQKLVFFHHDPARTDSRLEALEKNYSLNAAHNPGPELLMAREGMTLEL